MWHNRKQIHAKPCVVASPKRGGFLFILEKKEKQMGERSIVSITKLPAKELDTRLGACRECGWRRGIMLFENGLGGLILRITCMAVQDGKVLVRPMQSTKFHLMCKRRSHSLAKREGNKVFSEKSGVAQPPYASAT